MGLLPFIKGFGKQYNLRMFSSKKMAIDASCWIHKGLYVSMNQNGNRKGCPEIFRPHLHITKESGIVPVVVFDGLPLPAKAVENQRRQRQRESLLARSTEPNISEGEAKKLRSQAASIVHQDVVNCINVCKEENAKYLVSPYESDAQIAYMVGKGQVDFAVTEDSDLLAYGCKKVVIKNIKGFGIRKAYELTKKHASDFAQALSQIRGAPES